MRRMVEAVVEIDAEVRPVVGTASDVAEDRTCVRLRMKVADKRSLQKYLRSP